MALIISMSRMFTTRALGSTLKFVFTRENIGSDEKISSVLTISTSCRASVRKYPTMVSTGHDDPVDPMIHEESIDNRPLRFFHFQRKVTSTQDEAKQKILQTQLNENASTSETDSCHHPNDLNNLPPNCHFVVIADCQSHGRGTSGRIWISSPGNLYLTYCLPLKDVRMSKLSLLPIAVGVIVAEVIQNILLDSNSPSKTSSVSLKWPNDVLLFNKKVAGILIESCSSAKSGGCWLLIGIGVNLMSHPLQLPIEDSNFCNYPSRAATSLTAHLSSEVAFLSPFEFGVKVAKAIHHHLVHEGDLEPTSFADTSSNSILKRWKSFAKLGEIYVIRQTGERVKTVGIEDDGQLRVRSKDGQERLLVSDYFL